MSSAEVKFAKEDAIGAMQQEWMHKGLKGENKSAKNAAVAATLIVALVFSLPDSRRLGTVLHIALPMLAFACSLALRQGPTILGRYIALEVGIKVPKAALGDHPINVRPGGQNRGFPSAHTAAATFGAVHLITHCSGLHPTAKGSLLLAAAFTGGSRVEAGRHTLWQAVAGALWGWVMAVISIALLRQMASWVKRTTFRLKR